MDKGGKRVIVVIFLCVCFFFSYLIVFLMIEKRVCKCNGGVGVVITAVDMRATRVRAARERAYARAVPSSEAGVSGG